MRVVIQRVLEASVKVNGIVAGQIGKGLLVLVGIEDTDNNDDIRWLAAKIAGLRIFDDNNGVMNLSLEDIQGQLLVVSQFTLYASTKKGNRPSYIRAAKGDIAIPIYDEFCKQLEQLSGKPVQRGIFGADMKVALINDGPVTISIDSKSKE
jgi:D-aminoacyl-tRNA deacylase